MSTTSSQFTLNDNIEGLANLCQCYDYLSEYPDPNTKTALEHIELQLDSLSDFAFQSLLFPRIVNYVLTYSRHTMDIYVYAGCHILEIDANSETPNVTFTICYDNTKPCNTTSEKYKITVMGALIGSKLVTIKIEYFESDELVETRMDNISKHTDFTKWLDDNI